MNGVKTASLARQPAVFDGNRMVAENLIPDLRPRLKRRHAATNSGAKKASIHVFSKFIFGYYTKFGSRVLQPIAKILVPQMTMICYRKAMRLVSQTGAYEQSL